MSIFRRVSLGVVLIGVIVGSVVLTRAQAATTVLGPTVCVQTGTNGSIGLDYLGSGVLNSTGGVTNIICTLFRDNTSNTNGLQDLEVVVRIDTAVPGTVTCDASSYQRKNGNALKTVRRSTSTVGTDVVLDWGSSLNMSVSRGTYVVRCQVPDKTTIRSIFYQEP